MSLLLAIAALPALAQDVLINEMLYDPPDSDDGLEWIELCNAGASTVDLNGWTVEMAGSSWSRLTIGGAITLAGTLDPGQYALIGYGSLSNPGAFDPNIQNGGSSTDGVRLVNASGSVVDTVLYDTNNSNGLLDDLGIVGTSFAPDVSSGKSIGRWPDCTDTNDSGLDFIEFSAGSTSPGAVNSSGGSGDTGGTTTCENPALDALITINEFEPNPDWSDTSSDSGREWIELYNGGSGSVDLSDWQLQFETKPDDWGASSGTFVIPAGTLMDPGEFLLLAGDEVASLYGLDASIRVITASEASTRDIDMGTASSNADGVRLVDCEGTPVDTVIYGHQDGTDGLERNSDGFLDDSGAVASSLAPKGNAGSVIGRIDDGLDTDLSYDDFRLMIFPTPGYSNTTEPDCPDRDAVKINELVVAPDDGRAEFVELYNNSDSVVSLMDWGIAWATSGGTSPDIVFDEDDTIGPGEYLVVAGGIEETTADIIFSDMSLGNAGSSADIVVLHHACGLPADTVIYGPTFIDDDGLPVDDWMDDAGVTGLELDDRLAPKPATGDALARCRDGEDTDDSYVDFVLDAVPTPGSANPDTGCIPPEPPRCEPGDGTVKINELYPNPDGTDAGNEWVELVNTGSETAVLDAWTLEWGTSSFSSGETFPAGVEIAPGGFLLVGDSEVPADVFANLSLGNASTAPDGVRLVDCREDGEPVVQDTVLYGGVADIPEDEELTDDAGLQTMAGMPGDGLSVGRMPDGQDSDDNAVDFITNMSPTPGAPNTLEGGDDGGTGGQYETADGGCSCGGDKSVSSGKSTEKSCATARPTGGWALLLLSVAAVRRRK